MLSKKITAAVAGALLFGSSVSAQIAPTAGLVQNVAAEESPTNSQILVGVGFALAAFVAILFLSDGDDESDDAPVSP